MPISSENILIEGGLSEDQALVYQSLLERGPQKAKALSSWSGIKRGLTYKILEQLENMGLVNKKGGTGAVTTFSASHPSLLLNKLEKDKKNLELATETVKYGLGNFISQFNLQEGKPNVQFFEGKEGIKKVVFDTLYSKTEILSFADNESVNKLYPELNKEYVPLRKKAQIKKRLISIDSEYIRNLAKNDDREFTERRLVTENFNFATVMQIYDGKISYINIVENKSIGVIIEDASIYEMHKVLFEVIWKNAKTITFLEE